MSDKPLTDSFGSKLTANPKSVITILSSLSKRMFSGCSKEKRKHYGKVFLCKNGKISVC